MLQYFHCKKDYFRFVTSYVSLNKSERKRDISRNLSINYTCYHVILPLYWDDKKVPYDKERDSTLDARNDNCLKRAL